MPDCCKRSMKGMNDESDAGISVKAGTMVVESLAVAVADPPPDALTWLVTGDAALDATLTVTVMGGYVPPAARASEREHVSVARVHPHPGPLIAVGVSPAGKVSVTETVPLVAAVPVFWMDRLYTPMGCP